MQNLFQGQKMANQSGFPHMFVKIAAPRLSNTARGGPLAGLVPAEPAAF
jgi:hypothetical protein